VRLQRRVFTAMTGAGPWHFRKLPFCVKSDLRHVN